MEVTKEKSTHKTLVDDEAITAFLKRKYPRGFSNLKRIQGGQLSQAFSFEGGGKKLILRMNKNERLGFDMDAYAYAHFRSANVPIPKIIEIGKYSEVYFAISEGVDGVRMCDLPRDKLGRLIPKILKTLDSIHSTDIDSTTGFGYWNEMGEGEDRKWRESLESNRDFSQLDDIYSTPLEKAQLKAAKMQIEDYLPLCPEDRSLIHGDFSGDNILLDDGDVAGVIDWGESRYGDFLWDVSWLNLWSPDLDFKRVFEAHCRAADRHIPYFEERMSCYSVLIFLRVLGFFARTEQKRRVEKLKVRLVSLL